MIKRALAALVACLAIAAIAAGCGGGSDSTSGADTGAGETTSGSETTTGGDTTGGDESADTGGPAPTKAVFIKEADAICGTSEDELLEEVQKFGDERGLGANKAPTQDEELELYEDVVLPTFTAESEAIGGLTPPAGDEQAVEEITDALDAGVEDAEANPDQLTEGTNPLADASSKAKAYGLKVCGAE